MTKNIKRRSVLKTLSVAGIAAVHNKSFQPALSDIKNGYSFQHLVKGLLGQAITSFATNLIRIQTN